jgi:aspartate/methionine/tyrosine aminotransferase
MSDLDSSAMTVVVFFFRFVLVGTILGTTDAFLIRRHATNQQGIVLRVLSRRLDGLDQPTVWTEFTPLAVKHNSVNLGQGYPDWDPPQFVKDSMFEAVNHRHANQYARSYGHLPLTAVLAEEYSQQLSREINPETEIVVATGVTNVLYCALQGLINPGDECLLLEPYFDIYSSQVQLAGGTCVYCPLRASTDNKDRKSSSSYYKLDLEELESKITDRTKVFILNTPHNPTGKIFSHEELQQIASIVKKYPQLIVISDEVYQHLVYGDQPHISIASLLWDQTITMSSSGKTFSCTGWKVGWAVGPSKLIRAISAVQQWCNFSPVTPTQDAIAQSMIIARSRPYENYNNYYEWLADDYKTKRQYLTDALLTGGMTPIIPDGGFFIMADTSSVDFPYDIIASTQITPAMPGYSTNGRSMPRDWALSRWLTQEVGVTAIPPSAFYSSSNIELASNTLRFAFCKTESTIKEAQQRFHNYFSS